jgi:hypothetical protein
MLNHNQKGGLGVMLLIALLVVLFGGALAFGIWANSGREDYKNNVDAKVAVAVTAAKQQQNIADNAQFAQEEKDPLRAYDGPEAYGSLVVNYPKTWSAYVDDTGNGNALVDGYFAPGTVPALGGQGSIFSLRVQVLSQAYSQAIQGFASQEQDGKLTAQVYALPKVPKVVGLEVTGILPDNNTGTMVVLPLRSETIEIWTDGTAYLSDFNNSILPNFSFSP